MAVIKKIKLHNFKRFQDFSVELNDKINLLIGDNKIREKFHSFRNRYCSKWQ